MGLRSNVIVVAIVCVLMSGCQSTVEHKTKQTDILSNPINQALVLLPQDYPNNNFAEFNIQSPEEVVSLSNAQQVAFKQYFYSPELAEVPEHRRLYRYIDDLFWGFTYLGKTYNAETALRLQSGNCMSLALLTSALADLVNVEIKYQRVNAEPVYHRHNNIMTLSTHVRSHLIESPLQDDEFLGIRGRIIVDYYPQRGNIRGGMLDESAFFSMYYRNLAADAMLKNDYAYAYALMHQALTIASEDVENVNTMAVVLNKMSFTKNALALYEFGLELEQDSLNLLSNYSELLAQEGDLERAEQIKSQVGEAYADNPYHWIDLAEQSIREGKYTVARRLTHRAIEQAPYLHEAYFTLARSYYLSQQSEKADQALQKAAELAYLPETEKLYQSKRFVLSHEVH